MKAIRSHRCNRVSNRGTRLLLAAFAVGLLSPNSTYIEHVIALQLPSPMYKATPVPAGQIACALNNLGDLAGQTVYSPGSDCHAVIWNHDSSLSPNVVDAGDYTSAHAINDAGEIAGSANGELNVLPFIWTQANGVQWIPLPTGSDAGHACAINQVGAVAGYAFAAQGTQAFLWTSEAGVQALPPLPGHTGSTARSINDSGKVVGTSSGGADRHAVLWTDSNTVQDLGTLPGDLSSEAVAINTSGQVIGSSEGPQGSRAFIWDSAGGMRALGMLPNCTESEALAINDSGIVVGTCAGATESRAFIWTAQIGVQDLNPQGNPYLVHPIDPTAGVSDLAVILISAYAINNKGQIIAAAIDLHTPCPDSDTGACPMDECAPAPKYFLLLTPVTTQ